MCKMNALLKAAIEEAWVINEEFIRCKNCTSEELEELLYPITYHIPIWDDMTVIQKRDALNYVYENRHDQHFGHSALCKAIHQATAYYCLQVIKEVIIDGDGEQFFADLDFTWRMTEETAEYLGLSYLDNTNK